MTRPHFSALVLLALATLLVSVAAAGPITDPSEAIPSLRYSIGGGEQKSIPVVWNAEDKVFEVANGIFRDETSEEGTIFLYGGFNPDPLMMFGGGALDLGGPSAFSFTFIMPLVPQLSNPTFVFDSFSASVSNGFAAGGVTVTALPPPPGIPTDGPPDEIQVYTLSDDGGATWKNVGLDQGPTTFIPLGSLESGEYGEYNEGFIPTVAGGPWTHMRADINFMLSGGGDNFTFNGVKALVPEPGTVLLSLLAMAGCWCFRRVR